MWYDEMGGMYMELRVLNYFLTVAREGGLTGASEVLHVTQPTMSRQVSYPRTNSKTGNPWRIAGRNY